MKIPPSNVLIGGNGGGWGIRTPEGLHPTRFPSVRHRPLGESSWCASPVVTYPLIVYENTSRCESVGCYLGNKLASSENFAYTESRLLTWRHLRLIPQGRNAARRPGSGGCVRSPFIFIGLSSFRRAVSPINSDHLRFVGSLFWLIGNNVLSQGPSLLIAKVDKSALSTVWVRLCIRRVRCGKSRVR